MPRSPKQYIEICAEGRGAKVFCVDGRHMQVRGSAGSWVTVAEFSTTKGDIIGFVSGTFGKDGLKPDTWYRARNGKLVEV